MLVGFHCFKTAPFWSYTVWVVHQTYLFALYLNIFVQTAGETSQITDECSLDSESNTCHDVVVLSLQFIHVCPVSSPWLVSM